MTVLSMKNVGFKYDNTGVEVLKNVNIEFESGKFYAVVGKSGSGKSTFLGLLAGLDTPTTGEILVDKFDIAAMGYSYHRKNNIALVFQSYNLIDYLTPMENLKLVNSQASNEVLKRMGLEESIHNRNIMQLSGGQQQRVAIGRALVSKAPIILADEPTGNLDEETTGDIIKILKEAAHKDHKCVIVVTHSDQLAKSADVVYQLKEKSLVKNGK
ncbi:ABC transporter ATP-binding protein [Candidatus Saccharibacteria bacterium]|nr:ABC transporter ATP-binding protein [Candidatus Saccharibacteria bacterium]